MTSTTNSLPMEAQERISSENASKSEDPVVVAMNPDVPVDPGTLSTAEASLGLNAGAVQDASVISAITDHASLEGTFQPIIPTEGVTMPAPQDDPEVPKQVILPEDGRPAVAPPPPSAAVDTPQATPGISVSPPPPPSETLVVTTLAPDTQSTVSTSALPDPPKALCAERAVSETARAHPRSISSEEIRASTPMAGVEPKDESDMDDYIRSPEVQNAIVERSPGGRYVRFMEKLGSGASKDVYRAYDTQEGIEVAWNVVTLSGVPRTERNRIINEVRLLERLHHQNIISFHGSWVNRERQEINFVTEILSSGTLKSFIKKVQVIRWKIAKRWAVQILHGLAYLHSQDPPVIHRDLKCENIFINGTSGDLRIGDLGLSTVHRNGKVLSVLGTPEFMAPDMYEETPYDEKVDIYAFGMCMLEIFTKEIPYSECKNPAQIYKKVSAGEPPEVLTRLESRHARDFVMLCLGYRDENGKYIRPSADELLKHSFLDKRNNDDDEVIVERPLRERIIPEVTESSSTSPNGASQRDYYNSNGGSPQYSTNPPQGGSMALSEGRGRSTEFRESGSMNSSRVQHARMQSTNSLEDDGNDHFEEMPESESNMKKVKVMIGRGQELKEDDAAPHSGGVPPGALHAAQAAEQVHSPVPAYHQPPAPQPTAAQPLSAPQVAPPAVAPPADNQPPAHNYLVAAAVIEDEAPHVRPYADDILKLVVTLPVEGQTQNVQFDFHLVRDDPVQVAKEMVQELRIPQGAVLEISETISALACSARMKQDSHNLKMQEQAMQAPPPGPAVPSGPMAAEQVNPAVMADPHTVQPLGQNPPQQHNAGHGQVYSQAQPHGEGHPSTGQASIGQASFHGMHGQQSQQHYAAVSHPQAPTSAPALSTQQFSDMGSTAQPEIQHHHTFAHAPASAQMPAPPPVSAGASPVSPRMENRAAIGSAAVSGMGVPFAGNQNVESAPPVGVTEVQRDVSPPVSDHLGLTDEDDEDIQAELRRLEEEYERNLERAKKVFDSRMVNLQRSQKEKEKEHLKTLEKHQKERAEFEKRRALEEEQQQRRIEQLQKERDRKIHTLALEKRRALMQSGSEVNPDVQSSFQDQGIENNSFVQSERSTGSWNQQTAPSLQQAVAEAQNTVHSLPNGMNLR